MTGRYVRTGDIKKDASRLFLSQYGGASRSRTEVHGFAIRCIATLPTRQLLYRKDKITISDTGSHSTDSPNPVNKIFCFLNHLPILHSNVVSFADLPDLTGQILLLT